LRPTLWAGRLDINMATRKKHTPEQVVRKLATADRMLNEGNDVADVWKVDYNQPAPIHDRL
jgi:hypothetical protein